MNGMIGCVAEAISTVVTGVGVAVHMQFLVTDSMLAKSFLH